VRRKLGGWEKRRGDGGCLGEEWGTWGGGGSAPWRLSERRLWLGACAGGALGFGGGWATRQVARWVAGGGGGERGMGWAAGGAGVVSLFFVISFSSFLFFFFSKYSF
jgi:hypothetical protein